MILNFTKMQGIGNDYIYINCLNEEYKEIYKFIPKICNRNFGIGSDGVIMILPSDVADCKMRIINSDGSEGEMCGNGIRCVGKYLYDKRITNKSEISVETLAGIKKLKLKTENNFVTEVTVDMGEPSIEKDYIKKIYVGKKLIELKCISMGNPHAVVIVNELENLEIEKIGPIIENNIIFPNRTNVEFVRILDRSNIQLRVWERGSGETLACGTGASASSVICALENYIDNNVIVHLIGGDLKIEWDKVSNHVYMTGPAETVFEGEIEIN